MVTSDLFSKKGKRGIISNENFHLCEDKISLKPYKQFSNELPPIILGVFQSWHKLSTIESALKR